MKEIENMAFESKKKLYQYMNLKLLGLISDETDWLANLSNAAALINMLLKDINWVGFYLYRKDKLILGPFQGKPACVNIEIGKGVCGRSGLTKETQLVENVQDFPGHIACDSASKSELVIPILVEGELMGVLDIDSPMTSRFTLEDQDGLEKIVETLKKYVRFDQAIKA